MTPQPQTSLYNLYIDPKDNWFTVVHPNSRAWSSTDLYHALSSCKEGWQFTSAYAKANTFVCSFNSLPHLQSLMPELFI